MLYSRIIGKNIKYLIKVGADIASLDINYIRNLCKDFHDVKFFTMLFKSKKFNNEIKSEITMELIKAKNNTILFYLLSSGLFSEYHKDLIILSIRYLNVEFISILKKYIDIRKVYPEVLEFAKFYKFDLIKELL